MAELVRGAGRAVDRDGRRVERVKDEAGRTRLDRPFTSEDAKGRDAATIETLGAGRTGRVDPNPSGTEKRARAKRSSSQTRCTRRPDLRD